MQESDTDWSKVDFTDFVASSSALLQFFNYFSFVPDQQHYVDEFGLDILPFIFRSIKKAFYALSPDGLDYLAVESKALEVCRNFLALSNSRECIISVHNALEDLNNEFSMNDQIDPTAIDNHFPLRHLIFVLLIGLDTLGKLQSTKKHLFYEDFLNSWNKLFTKLQIFSINFPMSTFFERSIEETWASLLSDHEGYTFIFSLLHSLLTLSQSATPFPVYLQKLLVEFIKQLEAKAKEYPLLIASLSNSSIHFKDETCHIVLNSLLGSTKPINWHYAYFFLQQKNPIDLRPVLPSLSHCISILCWEQNLRNALFKEVLTPWLNTLPPGNLEPVLIELLLQSPYWNFIHACIPFLTQLEDPSRVFMSLIEKLKIHRKHPEAQKVWDAVFLTSFQCKHKMNLMQLQYIASCEACLDKDDLLSRYHLEILREYVSSQ